MKFEKKQVFYLVLTFILCYGILANWRNGTAIVTTIYKTSLPFFYGAAGAYIVNIVMSAYEKVYVYIFKDWSHVLKVKRGICLLLAYLTFFILITWIISIVIP
ncbi:TPA: AI-2E family transporter, partial [Streptococcus pyogenes]